MFVLDTNVVSALMRLPPQSAIDCWIAAHAANELFTTTISQAEVFAGLTSLPQGNRRAKLLLSARDIFAEDFAGRVLGFDVAAALEYAEIFAARRRPGRQPTMADTMIAAIARAHQATVVTRNVRDFDGCGVEVVNPWHAPVT
jgi:toxin FitB